MDIRTYMRSARPADNHGGAIRTQDEGQEEDELAMPMVTSDVLGSSQPRIRKPPSSVISGPQTSGSARMSQHPTAQPPQSPSHMRLAVHIKSSPVTPFTPINAPSTREPSILPSGQGRTRGQASAAQTSKRPPTPDAVALLGTDSEAPSSEPKKRGRPKGWKPGTPYSIDPNSRYRKREMKAAGLLTHEGKPRQDKNRGQTQETKRRGRPPRPPELSVREQYLKSTPSYVSFKCEWDLSEGSQQQQPLLCPAELQNMDTLRRHVFLIHGDMDPLVCRFSHCKEHKPPLEFKTENEFKSHMEKKHFARYLWHFGEGCQNDGIWALKNKADKLPTYLFDENGNQVTPSVADQKLESDLQHKERRRKLRKLLRQQNENAPTEEEWMNQMMGILGPDT
ncbi:hypothetical protein RRF57_008245 [Xylaria bambusicola]|uniref:C2H2-type domain-containing protein n=1 Tax=Xylaria bambusicola TaxID=326684 RepID=A0AAN7UUZ8_9PEZI